MTARSNRRRPDAADGVAGLIDEASRLMVTVDAGRTLSMAAVGWATVELDRAEAWFVAVLAGELRMPFEPALADSLLGAFARVGLLPGGRRLVLLEPNTEGRLAAFLAAHGEGLAAVYVSEPRSSTLEGSGGRGADIGSRPGPLGPARLLAGDRAGPFVVAVAGVEEAPGWRDTIGP